MPIDAADALELVEAPRQLPSPWRRPPAAARITTVEWPEREEEADRDRALARPASACGSRCRWRRCGRRRRRGAARTRRPATPCRAAPAGRGTPGPPRPRRRRCSDQQQAVDADDAAAQRSRLVVEQAGEMAVHGRLRERLDGSERIPPPRIIHGWSPGSIASSRRSTLTPRITCERRISSTSASVS